ncbi:DUF4238 domain-containing protein [Phenylobacterium sp.]|jgi:hypothetical protein|uniref:DUF4238 domain-containing protein n=1 Tax=Phenylobacterium sp. TaxID=1871053 RepID=UPI0035B2F435
MDHHIVPQFLLRPWAAGDDENKLHAYLYRRGVLSKKKLAPKGTSYRPELYALSRDKVAGADRQSVVTQVLQHLDDAAADVRLKMVRNTPLTAEDMLAWARFLIGLKARQPQTVDHLRQAVPEQFRAILAERPEEYEAVSTGSAPSLEAWTETALPGLIENFGLLILGGVASHPPLFEKLVRLKWGTIRFPAPAPQLLLGDNSHFVGGNLGDANFVVALPIGPRQAFLATATDEGWRKLVAYPRARLAENLNAQTIRLASEKIYAADWAAEDLIRARLQTFGEINRIHFDQGVTPASAA